jgi:Tryptophan-associated transmembrane protein (Trp_oprn_chp)
MSPNRQLPYAVVACLAGAGLALFAATRTWVVDVVNRPGPLPPIRTGRTGGDLLAWLPALAVVGLAGAGALLATRAAARRAIGVLLLLVGLGVAAGAGYAATAHDDVRPVWPVLCVVGGAVAAAVGVAAAARGQRWPAMGGRYERAAARPAATSVWDALDRGEDPTAD